MSDMIMTILLAIVAAVAGGFLYTIVGIIPGTDETATMVPTTIILVLAGAPAGVAAPYSSGANSAPAAGLSPMRGDPYSPQPADAAKARRASARSVRSQVKSGSSRPKWP